MAKQLHDMVDENYFQPPPGFEEEGSFLKNVIEPIFKVLQKVSAKSSGKIHIKLLDVLCLQSYYSSFTLKEAQKSRGGTAGHSAWRNYDDLNELFW
jgi:callose synthase